CILDEDGSFYFLEMNTRLQVEHTVTEMVTGLDLVALQIRVALGEKIDLSDVRPTGHAIQCRINAEDPARNFLPGPGRVTAYREPSGPFVRVDSAVRAGREIPADYDSMFAKVIVSAENRVRAIARMDRALSEFQVEGVPTTIPPPRRLLAHRAFSKSTHSTTWLEKALRDAELPEAGTPGPPPPDRRQPAPPDPPPEGAGPPRRAAGGPGRAPARGGRPPGARPDLRPAAGHRPEGAIAALRPRRRPRPQRHRGADAGHDPPGARRARSGDPGGRRGLHPRGDEDGERDPGPARGRRHRHPRARGE